MSNQTAQPSNVVSLSERMRQSAQPKASDHEAYEKAVEAQWKAREEAYIMSLGW